MILSVWGDFSIFCYANLKDHCCIRFCESLDCVFPRKNWLNDQFALVMEDYNCFALCFVLEKMAGPSFFVSKFIVNLLFNFQYLS